MGVILKITISRVDLLFPYDENVYVAKTVSGSVAVVSAFRCRRSRRQQRYRCLSELLLQCGGGLYRCPRHYWCSGLFWP